VATNLLILPLVQLTILTGTNEDWIDGIAFYDLSMNPLSLAGIAFKMTMRHLLDDATAPVSASTEDGDLVASGNIFNFNVPLSTMGIVPPADYVFDVVGIADGHQRVIIQGAVTVFEGVTR
jgi:hypothetical protein